MKSSLSRRVLFLLPFACAALYGCPQQKTETEPVTGFEDVIFEGDTTDEAMVALGSAIDQKAPIDDAARSPVLASPKDKAALPKSPIPQFSWSFGAASFLETPAPRSAPALLRPTRTEEPSFSHALAQLFGPPRAASAHGDPFAGTGTYLVFSTKSDAKLVRVFTGLTTYTPAQEVWDKMVKAGTDITLELVAANFDNNRIADGGAPVKGSKITFTVTP